MQGEFSHYDILELIGAGGMGEVYRARDRKLGREVALKILPAGLVELPEARARFVRESRLAARLSHPNIATVFDADELDGQLFFAMELVDGDSLQDRVRRGGLSPEALLDLAIPLVEGLAAAHGAGIVHRDLKPGNVMIDEHGRPKILDFGLSMPSAGQPDDSARLTGSGQILGTPQYMSPEQARGQELDARSDLFSLGSILYELAVGTRAFYGNTPGEVMEAVLRAEPPPLQRANPRIGDDLARVITRLLDKDRGKRVQTAHDLLAELRAIRGHSSAPKRAQARWVAVAVVAAALIALTLWFTSAGDEAHDLPTIAVLPFAHEGATKDYFSEGVTDAITARLARLRGLRVISRQSTMGYLHSDKSPAEIGGELGVAFILRGSVRRERADAPDSKVRVIPELIGAADDSHIIWTETYDESITKVFEVQSRIADHVAQALDIELGADRDVVSPTEDLEAYDLFLRGNKYRSRGGEWSEKNLTIAADLFGRAIELDPEFALAYALRSRCHVEMHYYWHVHDNADERLRFAKRDADAALERAPKHPMALLAMGQYYYYGLLDNERALQYLERARESAPSDTEVITNIAFVHRRLGNWQEAVADNRLAADLDPRNVETLFNLGISYWLLRDYDDADQWMRQAIELAQDFAKMHAIRASRVMFGEGDPKRARLILEQGARVSDPSNPVFALTSIQVSIWAGERERALREIAALSTDEIDVNRVFASKASLRAQVRGLKEDFEAALQLVELRLEENAGDASLHSARGIALAGLGRTKEAVDAGKRAVELRPIKKDGWRGSLRVTDLAHIHVMVGEPDAAIDLIEKLLAIPGEMGKASLGIDPRWEPLRGLPRFQVLMK